MNLIELMSIQKTTLLITYINFKKEIRLRAYGHLMVEKMASVKR